MKHQKNSENAPLADQGDELLGDTFSDLLSAVSEEENDHFLQETDAFDRYVQKVQSKLHTDFSQFRSRFVKGYQTLLEELKSEQKTH